MAGRPDRRAKSKKESKGPQSSGRPGLAQTGHERRTTGGKQATAKEPEAPPEIAPDAYVVTLPTFEGPLDLLLHLIQKHELNILDIPIGFVTEKYLLYLSVMRSLTIDVASEYLVMAATLAHIKSKMLLPDLPDDSSSSGEEEEEEDPRLELVRRLLEYQKYKAAAEQLNNLDTLGAAVFPKTTVEFADEGPAPFAAFGVFDLLDAFTKLLGKTKTVFEHEVVFDRVGITERIVELTDLLKVRGSVPFEEIFRREGRTNPTKFELIITFLAVLEMCRLKMMRVYQTEPLAPLHVDLMMLSEDGEELPEEGEPSEEERSAISSQPSASEREPSLAAEPQPIVEGEQSEAEPEPVARAEQDTEPVAGTALEAEVEGEPVAEDPLEVEAEIESRADAIAEPEAELIAEPEAEVIAEPEAEAIPAPEAEAEVETEAPPVRSAAIEAALAAGLVTESELATMSEQDRMMIEQLMAEEPNNERPDQDE